MIENIKNLMVLCCFLFIPICINGQSLIPVSISNNYYSSSSYGVFQVSEDQFLCNLIGWGFYNIAFHNGLANEPTVGDYIIYNIFN